MFAALAWRNLWRNPLRSSIMVASMVFGLTGVVLMVGFVRAMTASMVENAIRYQLGHLQVHSPAFLVNEDLGAWIPGADPLAAELRAQPGVAGVTVRQVVDGMVASAATTRGVRIHGVDPGAEARVTHVDDRIVEGRGLPPTGRNPILLSRRLGRKLNLRLASKVVLTFSDLEGDVSGAAFRVCGFFDTPSTAFDEGSVFVRRSDLARYTRVTGAHEIAVRLADPGRLDELLPTLSAVVGDRGRLQTWAQVQPLLAAVTGSFDTSNRIMITVFVLALGLGIVNTMMMSVFERTREFGVLVAVGMTRGRVLGMIVLEAFLLGGVGGLAGLGTSAGLITVLGRVGLPFGPVAEGMGVMGVDTVLYPTVPAGLYAQVFAMVLATSLVAGLYPARRILKKRPSEALAERH